MKKYGIGFLFLMMTFTGVAQQEGDSRLARVFQRLVIDVGASPVSFSFPNSFETFSYNFAMGYQFKSHFQLRFQYDLIQSYHTYDGGFPNGWGPWSTITSERLFALGVGGNYRWCSRKPEGLFKGVGYSIALKAGATFSESHREQQSIYYDLSARFYPKRNCYFAVGFNHDLFADRMRLVSRKEHLETIYFSFGIEF